MPVKPADSRVHLKHVEPEERSERACSVETRPAARTHTHTSQTPTGLVTTLHKKHMLGVTKKCFAKF